MNNDISRKEFLALTGGLVSALILPNPIKLFIPPRKPYVSMEHESLYALVSQLGIFPHTEELGNCEGKILKIDNWDGIGYPCLVENWCGYRSEKPKTWIYDFDLWNFRHDDDLFTDSYIQKQTDKYNSYNMWYAHRRFGMDLKKVVKAGGGWLSNNLKYVG